jgi:hypothetical protein
LQHQKETKSTEPFILYLEMVQKQTIVNLEERDIQTFNQVLLLSLNFKFWSSKNDPEMNLFYWCILSKRLEIAKIFWKMGKVKHSVIKKILNTFKA